MKELFKIFDEYKGHDVELSVMLTMLFLLILGSVSVVMAILIGTPFLFFVVGAVWLVWFTIYQFVKKYQMKNIDPSCPSQTDFTGDSRCPPQVDYTLGEEAAIKKRER
ncbi:hypothetical protein HYS94_02150 [Candidatus Daviesbacteria bacterium]|nr:hypothetical protein [Candidatus Daviesbacteria bacterium]